MGKSANVTVFDPRLRESIGERLGSIGFDKDRNEIVYISDREGILKGNARLRGCRKVRKRLASMSKRIYPPSEIDQLRAGVNRQNRTESQVC